MLIRTAILLLILSAELISADFFSYYENFTRDLYQDKEITKDKTAEGNGWNRICGLYKNIYELRLLKKIDRDKLENEAEDIIEEISEGRIKGLSEYDKDLLTAVLYGSLAYIQSSDPSYSMFGNIKRSKKLFDKLQIKYKTKDSGFGSALSDISLVMYFQDSFWINSVLGYTGNIKSGLKHLDKIAFEGGITKIEANLFLVEYFGQILHDHHSSLKYSRNLWEINTGSKYFQYLYAKDLYHTGKIMQALEIFRIINSDIGGVFYAYQYDSIIYEARCLYITGSAGEGDEVSVYASKIHDGYILKKFRNEWRSSVRLRQESVFRPLYVQGQNLKLSDDEILRTCRVYFDHGFFRETARLIGNIRNKDQESLVLAFRTAAVMNEWKKADEIYDSNEEIFENDQDRLRLEVINNIVSANL